MFACGLYVMQNAAFAPHRDGDGEISQFLVTNADGAPLRSGNHQ
jgi:hypothetical protein